MTIQNKAMGLVTAFALLAACGNQTGQAEDYECCDEQEMSYANGDINLAGLLLSPKADGQYPGIVLIQGSGTSDRTNGWARMIAETLVEDGFAVLLTDKRGSGSSSGDWRAADFDDLARDTLAGVEALRNKKETVSGKVGVIGLSQGGHIAPLAAALGEVDFVIDFVGSALPMKETLIHELEMTYRQHGAEGEALEFLQSMTHASFKFIETGEGWEDYLAIRSAIAANLDPEAVASWPDSQDHWYWGFWRGIHDFDPIPYWKIAVEDKGLPGFVAYGEKDENDNVPVAASVARFKDNISSDTLEVHVYPNTGHTLMDEEKYYQEQYQLVEPLLADLEVWLDKNVIKKN